MRQRISRFSQSQSASAVTDCDWLKQQKTFYGGIRALPRDNSAIVASLSITVLEWNQSTTGSSKMGPFGPRSLRSRHAFSKPNFVNSLKAAD